MNFVTFDDVMSICLMMMDQWMEDDAGEPALNKDFLSGLRDLKVKDGNFSNCCCLPYSVKIGLATSKVPMKKVLSRKLLKLENPNTSLYI